MYYLKYRYFIKMRYDDFINIDKVIAYHINKNDEVVTFYTTKKGLSCFKECENIEVVDIIKQISNKIMKKYLIFILSLLIIIVIMLTSSFFVRDIVFKNHTVFNYDIDKSIKEELKQFGFLYYLDISLNDLNKKLRKSYPHFAYIGVVKVGSKLEVEIVEQKLFGDKNIENNNYGDIVAGADGYILQTKSSKGVVNVTISQSVKKGDLLISGNLNYKINPSNLSKLVIPEGVVIASTASYEKIIVPKKIIEKSYTGNMIIRYRLTFLNNVLFGKKYTDNSFGHIVFEDIFTIDNFVSFSKVNIFEEEDILTYYDYDTAYNYALSKIMHEFNIVKKHDNEKIISIDFIKFSESTDQFTFDFLVNKIQNIAYYKKYD